MNNIQIILVADAIEKIAIETGSEDVREITECLTGVCFDEETAGKIRQFHSSENDI